MRVTLDVADDEGDPYATLSAWSDGGELLAQTRVAPTFALSTATARR